MSGRCRHESTTGYMWREGYGPIPSRWEYAFTQPGRADHHHKIVCDDCHAWLSLGHSDESPERVAVEIRAAEIAALASEWESTRTIECATAMTNIGGPKSEASELARVIATHKETP